MKKLILLIGLLLMTSSAFADGFIVPEPWVPIAVKYHRVTVDIRDQATTTHIDQMFINDSDVENIEGTFLFPIPKGASFSAFTMYVDNEPYSAQIMDADSARAIYEEIVRRRKDPALLEYVGEETYRARIFPIPAHGEKQVVLSYDEIISCEGGLCRYVYPLNTEKFSSKPLEEVSVTVNLYSTQPLKNIYSPSHEITIEKTDDHNAKITYFEENVLPDKDFILYYTVSTEEVGLALVTYRESEDDGFYLLLVSPKVEMEESEIARKRIIFVLDTSGSMKGDKIAQAKEALKFCLNNLNDRDRFDIVDYNSAISKFRDSPVEATSEDVAAAVDYVDRLGAEGATDINGALLTALALMEEDDFTNMIIFLTDGKPTIAPKDNETILTNVHNANQYRTRIFVFGVGFNVNTHLLDRLASENHGISTYVLPEEDIQFVVSSFYSKVSDPVLSDLSLDLGSITASDYYPIELPDLFQGSQLVQLGRYSGSGETTVMLSGQSGGTPEKFIYEGVQFPSESLEHEFIPRLWATRKIGYLLDQIRLHGFDEEIKDAIVALSKRYGIITPYTSFLILEDEPPEGTFDERLWTENTGEYAVRAADDTKRYGGAENVGDVQSTEVKYVGNKTFFLRDGVWTDSQYTQDEPTLDYEYGSEKYFSLLIGKPELGRYLAIGKNVLLCFDSQNYRILEETTAEEEEEETQPVQCHHNH
jgi:Ca-activated chloride channel family protein